MHWLESQHEVGPFQAIAIAAPDEEDGNEIPEEALTHDSVKEKFDHKFLLWDGWSCLQEPWDFLGDILEQLLREVQESARTKIDDKIGKIEEKINEHLELEEAAGNEGYQQQVEALGVLRNVLRVLLHDEATAAGEDQQNQTQEMILDETAQKTKMYLESAGEKGSCRIGVEHPKAGHSGRLLRSARAFPGSLRAGLGPRW
jgi:hypothetical protein